MPGSVWAVVGVAHDDRLDVRSGPAVGAPVVGSLDPTASQVTAVGDAVAVAEAVWWDVAAGDLGGWVNASYLGALGDTDDVASSVSERLGRIPSAQTMDELAAIVASVRSEGSTDARIVTVAAADDAGDFGEVTIDVFVDGDDAIRGERIVVFGQRIVEGGDFSLYAAESTPICWRGVDPSGLCV
jgi:hypothetical protein